MIKFVISILIMVVMYGWAQPVYVTTIHPFQEILGEVVGERGEVIAILPPGASPHTHELRPSEIRKIESATALFFGSPNLDKWALKFQNPNRIKLLGLLPEDILLPLRMDEQDRHNALIGIDPHFWTDPLTVKTLLPILADTLSLLDPEAEEMYRINARQFSVRLDSLHSRIQSQLSKVQRSSVMLSHPFFRYFLKRYQIPLAGIIEVIPGKEPTPLDMKQIINRAPKEQVKAILSMPQHSSRPAEIVAESTGIPLYELDPLGGEQGRQSYADLLLFNTHILIKALQ